MLLVRRARRWALRKLICKIVRHDESKTIHVKVICFWIHHGCIILHTMFYNAVHLHMQYYSFANTILKCAAFQFFTPAGKPTVNFYFTFTVTIAFFFPALTVIFAVPAFLAFTTPFAFTVATFLLLLVNVTLSEAVIG